MPIISTVFTATALGLVALLLSSMVTRATPRKAIAVCAAANRKSPARKMFIVTLAAGIGIAGLGIPTISEAGSKPVAEIKVVQVLGRSWHVAKVEEKHGSGQHDGDATNTGRYMAQRQNAELDPLRPPAVLTARQAVRAFHAATGCRANINTMVRSIDGTYSAQLICR
ncbi:hypothetical protein [Phaeobacter sp. C3_T13_0]|uniref:hypothetical protein n=1 Tax=Phaeobacter cretensis TaxID=3342641 RepID=UPI0039BCBD67